MGGWGGWKNQSLLNKREELKKIDCQQEGSLEYYRAFEEDQVNSIVTQLRSSNPSHPGDE